MKRQDLTTARDRARHGRHAGATVPTFALRAATAAHRWPDSQHQLWGAPAIPGQLTLELGAAGKRSAEPTRRPVTAAIDWSDRAAIGGLIVSLRDLTTGRSGIARWYALGIQDRLDGGADIFRAWGRLGTAAPTPPTRTPYPSWPAAHAALAEHVTRRAARGYQPT